MKKIVLMAVALLTLCLLRPLPASADFTSMSGSAVNFYIVMLILLLPLPLAVFLAAATTRHVFMCHNKSSSPHQRLEADDCIKKESLQIAKSSEIFTGRKHDISRCRKIPLKQTDNAESPLPEIPQELTAPIYSVKT